MGQVAGAHDQGRFVVQFHNHRGKKTDAMLHILPVYNTIRLKNLLKVN